MYFSLLNADITENNKTETSSTLLETVLETVDSIKYLGIRITHDFRWNTHIYMSNISTTADITLDFLKRNLSQCRKMKKRQHIKDVIARV